MTIYIPEWVLLWGGGMLCSAVPILFWFYYWLSRQFR